VVVGDGAQRAADARAVEEHREHGDQDGRDQRRSEVELGDVESEAVGDPRDRLVGDADVEAAHV
jgi:hypothetical protein